MTFRLAEHLFENLEVRVAFEDLAQVLHGIHTAEVTLSSISSHRTRLNNYFLENELPYSVGVDEIAEKVYLERI